jgi:hypothetical protein
MRPFPFLASLAFAATAIALPAATSPVAGQECEPGTLYYSRDNNENGLYTVDVATGAASPVGDGVTGVTSNTVGLTESNDPAVLWGSTWTDFTIINADGSGANVLPTNFQAEALGYEASSGVLYGSINGQFFTVDPATGQRVDETLAEPDADIEGLAADASTGLVYGIAGASNSPLYVYDPVGDDWSTIPMSVDVDWDSVGLAFDPGTSLLYAINENGDVYSITLTGQVTPIGNLGIDGGGGGAGFVGGCPTPPPTTPTTEATTTTTTAAPPPTTAAAPTTRAAAAATVTPRFTG